MKKLKYLLFLILLFPFSVDALSFTCDNYPLIYGAKFKCNLNGNPGDNFEYLYGLEPTSSAVECKSLGMNEGFTPVLNEEEEVEYTAPIVGNKIEDFYRMFDLKGTAKEGNLIYSFRCSVNKKLTEDEDVSINIDEIKYKLVGGSEKKEKLSTKVNILKYSTDQQLNENSRYPEEQHENPTSSENVTTSQVTTALNTSNYLRSIYCPDFSINFSKYKYNYDLEVLNEVTDLSITTDTEDPMAKVEIEGNKGLVEGKNIVDIFVTDQNNQRRSYRLNVTRLKKGEQVKDTSKDATLFSMNVVGYNINFKSNKYEYDLPLATTIDKVTVEAELNNPQASMSIKYPEKLNNGSKIIVNVISADQSTTKQYVINIQKEESNKSNLPIIIAVSVIILLIILFLLLKKIKKQNESDKILGLKWQKREINRGEKFDINHVPDVNDEADDFDYFE